MKELVFLVEEPSMEALLLVLLPKIVTHEGVSWTIIPHEGKADLNRSIPRKLRSWMDPNARFVILQDKDSSDCVRLKQRLIELCPEHQRKKLLVRIVCTELESWFIGDLRAVALAFNDPNLETKRSRAKYRDPDTLANAADELSRLVPEYQKLSGARKIAQHLDVGRNRSKSFRVFVNGLTKLLDA